jgi:hypothetical protein
MSELRFTIKDAVNFAFGRVGTPYLARLPRPNIVPVGAFKAMIGAFAQGDKSGQVGPAFGPLPTANEDGTINLQSAEVDGVRDLLLDRTIVMPVVLRWFTTAGMYELLLNKPEPMLRLGVRMEMKKDKADRARYRGTVKQGMVLDYSLSMKCRIMVGSGKEGIPKDQLAALRQMMELSETTVIECDLATLFNIREVVVESMDLDPVEGGAGAYDLSLNMLSDDAYPYTLLR